MRYRTAEVILERYMGYDVGVGAFGNVSEHPSWGVHTVIRGFPRFCIGVYMFLYVLYMFVYALYKFLSVVYRFYTCLISCYKFVIGFCLFSKALFSLV